MSTRHSLARLSSFLLFVTPLGAQEPLRLFTRPDLSATQICFTYAGDLWLVPRAGGDAHRLTATPGGEDGCRFSADGRQVAYVASREGNTDVYVVSVNGGTPTRLTWHPMSDVAVDWTPDGKVLFASLRDGVMPYGIPFQFYTQAVNEATATPLRLQGAVDAAYSSDGKRLAYTEFNSANNIWKRYRGGRTPGSGSPRSRTPRLRRCPTPARPTATRCGSLTRCSSSPIGTGRPRSTITTWPPRR